MGRCLQGRVNLTAPTILTPPNAASLGIVSPTPQQIGREVFSPGRLNTSFDDIYQLQDSAGSSYNRASLTLSRERNEELEILGNLHNVENLRRCF